MAEDSSRQKPCHSLGGHSPYSVSRKSSSWGQQEAASSTLTVPRPVLLEANQSNSIILETLQQDGECCGLPLWTSREPAES